MTEKGRRFGSSRQAQTTPARSSRGVRSRRGHPNPDQPFADRLPTRLEDLEGRLAVAVRFAGTTGTKTVQFLAS
jgi:hypothetical protein